MNADSIIFPQWPAHQRVKAAITTRRGGVSTGPWASLNLAGHVGDDLQAVVENRSLLSEWLALPNTPVWLQQVHGTDVLRLDSSVCQGTVSPRADAVCTSMPGTPCVVMTADCLPVLVCDRSATVVAASHAGWRGLAAGVLRQTVKAMGVSPGELLAYLGPAISQTHFEVGDEVKQTFMEKFSTNHRAVEMENCFIASRHRGKYRADLYQLAKLELRDIGVRRIYGGGRCTYTEEALFYSYRREGVTGRMASLIWLEDTAEDISSGAVLQ